MSIKNRAIGFLSRRDHGRGELRRKLLDKEQDPQEVDEALDALEAAGLLDDARTARELARYFAHSRGHGPMKIRSRLRGQHCIAGPLVDQALEALDADWGEICLRVTRSRKLVPDDPKSRAKMQRFLYGRGFSGWVARDAIEQRIQELNEP